MLYQESDLDVIVGGVRTIAEGMGAKWVDGQGIKATRRTVVDEVWNHPKDIALPFPFTLAQFRAFCDWHPSFEWEAIESPFTNDDDTLDEAALSELAIRGADAAKLVRQFLGVRGGAPAFEILPRPLEVPAALLALDSDAVVTAKRHWFDFAIEETTNAGDIKSEIEQRIKDQADGLFSIDEAACIAADALGLDRTARKKTREAIWKAIDDGKMEPLWCRARTPLPLPLTNPDKSLALLRTNELSKLFEAWPIKPQTEPAPTDLQPLTSWLPQVVEPPSEKPEAQGQGLGKGDRQEENNGVETPQDQLATPDELLKAFGPFTGMDKSWFRHLRDTPDLKKARKRPGVGGRHHEPPMFCPYEVMLWLTSPKRKKGRKMSVEKGWQRLREYFPNAYPRYSHGDPNDEPQPG